MAVITQDEVKTLLQITGTAKDDLIDMLIPIIENDIVEYCNNDFLNDADPPVAVWPAAIKLPAAQMIGYIMASMSGGGTSIGMQSETQGGYSYDKGSTSGNSAEGEYPAGILASLNKWRFSRVQFGTIRQQSRDRRGLSLPLLADDKYVPGVDGGPYEDNPTRQII